MHPVFGAEIFEIDPDGLLLFGHRLDIALRQLAGECLDHQFGGLRFGERISPPPHFHAAAVLAFKRGICFMAQLGQTAQIIHPQPHREAMLLRQLSRQPPAHADVAVVVDDVAEDVA